MRHMTSPDLINFLCFCTMFLAWPLSPGCLEPAFSRFGWIRIGVHSSRCFNMGVRSILVTNSPDHCHRPLPAWLDSQSSTDVWGGEIHGEGHVCAFPGNDSGWNLWLPVNILWTPLTFLLTGVAYKWPFWMRPYPCKITIADGSRSRVFQSLFAL